MKVIQRFDSKVNTCALIGWRKVRHWPIIARHQAEWGGGALKLDGGQRERLLMAVLAPLTTGAHVVVRPTARWRCLLLANEKPRPLTHTLFD